MQPFKVTYEGTQDFAKVWNHKGIAIPLLDPHIQFATDWANIVLKSFVDDMMAKAKAAKEKAAAEAKPIVSLV